MLNPDIIPFSITETKSWQHEIANSFKNLDELLNFLNIPQHQRHKFTEFHQFPLRVTHFYANLIKKNDLKDPLLLQIIPQAAENSKHPDYQSDAVGDLSAIKHPGLIHKYHGRVLLSLTAACGIHCRYCFRREFPYSENTPDLSENSPIFHYIHNNKDINEVILSGGDPLMLSDQKISGLLLKIEAIKHIQSIRFHTRMPSILPQRVTKELLQGLALSHKNIIIVLHINHANEINEEVVNACQQLKKAGVTLLNQSVLLKNINNSLDTLKQLSQSLFKAGIMPYYLHCLDKVSGTTHFDLSRDEARALIKRLKTQLPGYLIPKLVEEIEGEASKTHII